MALTKSRKLGGPSFTFYYYATPLCRYYYGSYTANNKSWSGHFHYNYTEENKIGAPGIEGGPNWPMMEYMANSTKRLFNLPHHVTTYLALYYAARNTNAKTCVSSIDHDSVLPSSGVGVSTRVGGG